MARARRLWVGPAAIGAALLVVLALLEVGMRVVQWAALRSRGQAAATAGSGGVTILAVGDSWTYGQESGDPATKSYPARLQALLDQKMGEGRYRVVNAGVPGTDSSSLVRRLPQMLKQHKPDVLLVQVGALNWINPDRPTGDNALGWQLRMAERGNAGPLENLRVYRMLRMILGPTPGERTARVKGRMDKVRKELFALADAPEARADTRGRPESSRRGCPEGQLSDDPASVLSDHPHCVAALVLAAEACLDKNDAACAKSRAERAAKLAPDDGRAALTLIRAERAAAGTWSVEMVERLDELWWKHKRYVQLLRALIHTELEGNMNLCSISGQVDGVLREYPNTPWATKLKAAVDRHLAGRELWDQRDRELRRDLAAIVSQGRNVGAAVMMLNYADQGGEKHECKTFSNQFFLDFSQNFGVPLCDIADTLSDKRGPDGRTDYSDQGHPNARGYQKIAARVLSRLLEEGLVSAAP